MVVSPTPSPMSKQNVFLAAKSFVASSFSEKTQKFTKHANRLNLRTLTLYELVTLPFAASGKKAAVLLNLKFRDFMM